MITNFLAQTELVRSSNVELKDRLLHRNAIIGVVGLGYVGLPLAVQKARAGFHVIGFDHDPERVKMVNAGRSYVPTVKSADLAAALLSGTIRATADVSFLATCDVVVICVPTRLSANRTPHTHGIRRVSEQIAATLRPGQLVTLESTTYPGTTEEVILPILSATGLRVGEDFFLAFSPERAHARGRRQPVRNTSRMLGAITPQCLDAAAFFYAQTTVDVVTVSNPRTAEMAKVFENTFRAVNIALVNELAQLCDRMGINVWEVIDAAATKPFDMMRFEPGPGVGGRYLPTDPFYLAWKAKEYDFGTRFIELAGEINRSMPAFVCDKIARALNARERSLRGAQVVFLGVGYKRDAAEWQQSPALNLLELIERGGGEVTYHDPLVPEIVDYDGRPRHSVALTPGYLRSADCAVVLADHAVIDWNLVRAESGLIVDTRNVYGESKDRTNIVRL